MVLLRRYCTPFALPHGTFAAPISLNLLHSRLCLPRLMLFFFQAEDGIRDLYVTGVQTCALPIFYHFQLVTVSFAPSCVHAEQHLGPVACFGAAGAGLDAQVCVAAILWAAHDRLERSEERRVGKDCWSRWAAFHYKKKPECYSVRL